MTFPLSISGNEMIRHFGHIENGLLHIRNARVFAEQIRQIEGKEIELRIRPVGDSPTHKTHKYYLGGVLPTIRLALEQHGYQFSDDEVHEYLKRRFLTETRFNHQKQTEYTVVFSTGEVSQQQFNGYIDKCRAFSHDTLGVYVLTGEEYESGDPVFREVEGSL